MKTRWPETAETFSAGPSIATCASATATSDLSVLVVLRQRLRVLAVAGDDHEQLGRRLHAGQAALHPRAALLEVGHQAADLHVRPARGRGSARSSAPCSAGTPTARMRPAAGRSPSTFQPSGVFTRSQPRHLVVLGFDVLERVAHVHAHRRALARDLGALGRHRDARDRQLLRRGRVPACPWPPGRRSRSPSSSVRRRARVPSRDPPPASSAAPCRPARASRSAWAWSWTRSSAPRECCARNRRHKR